MTTRIEMLNRALLRLGAEPLVSEADAGAAVHLAVYDSVIDYLTGVHPWSFFRATARLTRLEATPPDQHYRHAFQLPQPRMGALRAVWPAIDRRVPTTAYHLAGEYLLTDHEQIWVTFLERRSPVYWPGEFREGFTQLLMSELALSIREDAPLRERLRQNALGTPGEQPHGGVVGQAIGADSGSEPGEAVLLGTGNPLIDARY